MTWRSVPLRIKQGVQYHATKSEAEKRAQAVANKTGDWCAVEDVGDMTGPSKGIFWVFPNTTRRTG